jgi:hypothetical protein
MQDSLFAADGSARRIGVVHLHFGDWREVVDSWPRDAVPIFDPPYGIDYESGMVGRGWNGRSGGDDRTLAVSIAGDKDTRERDDVLSLGWSASAVFGPARLDRVPPWGDPRAVLIWDKGEGVGMGDLAFPWRPNYETIAVYGQGWAGKRTTSVVRGSVVAFGRGSVSNGPVDHVRYGARRRCRFRVDPRLHQQRALALHAQRPGPRGSRVDLNRAQVRPDRRATAAA